MALLNDIKNLDIGSVFSGGPYCRVAGSTATTYGLDFGSVFDGSIFIAYAAEEEPPPEPGVLSRFYPGLPTERTFPPLHAERTFPL